MYDKRNLRNAWSRPLLFSLSVKMEVLILALISITTKKKTFSRQDTVTLWWHWRCLQWQAVEAKHGTCTGDLPPLETLRWAFGFDDNTPFEFWFHIYQGVSGTGRLVKVGFLDFQILVQLVSSNISHQDVLLLIELKQTKVSVGGSQAAC